MQSDINNADEVEKENKSPNVIYNSDKDFYRGIGGELRYKAEGLFKKAKEKGISIEDIDVSTLRENSADFPGIGAVELPTFIIKIKGKHLQSGQIMVDGKQIDYFNRYQKYMAEKIEKKNLLKDEKGRLLRENNKPKIKEELELLLTEWERFEIGKSLVDDKEFGIEKTITGACDRVIRKLMGENDWLYPGEAKLLEEEFESVQNKIAFEKENKKDLQPMNSKKATERQVNYLKALIKNSGIDPENDFVINELIKHNGYDAKNLNDLSTGDMSKIIDSVNLIIPKIKDTLSKQTNIFQQGNIPGQETKRSIQQ